MADDERYDEVLVELAGRIGSVQGLLDTFFSFMHRKTDFYVEFDETDVNATMGFPKGVAEAMVQRAFRKYKMKKYTAAAGGGTAAPKVEKGPAPAPSSASAPAAPPQSPAPSAAPSGQTAAAAQPPAAPSASSVAAQLSSTLHFNDRGQQIPVGNGGVGPNYVWTQTLQEVTVYVDAATCTKGKDVRCDIQPTSLHVSVLGHEVIKGELEDAVRVDESMWTLNVGSSSSSSGKAGPDDASQVVITLEKTRKTWWKHVIVGHPEIDPTKVDSTQRIDEYDEQTQATIRKIMFDQKQKVRRPSFRAFELTFLTPLLVPLFRGRGWGSPHLTTCSQTASSKRPNLCQDHRFYDHRSLFMSSL